MQRESSYYVNLIHFKSSSLGVNLDGECNWQLLCSFWDQEGWSWVCDLVLCFNPSQQLSPMQVLTSLVR